ncbi:PCRF domain-containing protein [Candidatus Parcubacteria bacterium]|nr:PCRF domain-containing protein [Candidatus Parcubacteria bacterium]
MNRATTNPDVAILEIRAGAGGNEAGLFAAELYRMYSRFAASQGWKVKQISLNQGGVGNIKSVVAQIRGSGAYRLLQAESGVHRVQRVPETERAGRIHTSTATVAVLPEAPLLEVKVDPGDLKIDFFRASGHGGQNVNKVETAVRITHLPTKVAVECQEERSQTQNRERALQVLNAKLYQMMQQQQKSSIDELRGEQVGSAERADKIRTYHYPQNRVTDHRLGKGWGDLKSILNGNLLPILGSFHKKDLM